MAFQYPALAVNARGDVGAVFAWGGGIGTEHYYPGTGAVIFNPANGAMDVDFYLYGSGNACANRKDHKYRWGDYLTARVDYPYTNVFRGAGYGFQGNCGSGKGIEHTFVFGRKADMR